MGRLSLLAVLLLTVSGCALGQTGQLTGRSLLIRNTTPPGTGADVTVQSSARELRVGLGIATGDHGVLSLYSVDGAVASLSSEVGPTMLIGRNDALDARFQMGVGGTDDGSLTLWGSGGSAVGLGAELGDFMLVLRNDALAERFRVGIDTVGDDGELVVTDSGGNTVELIPATGSLVLDSVTITDGAAATYTMTLPAALPASITECLGMTTAGALVLSGAGCGGSGGVSSGTNDEIQISDNASGFTSLANFRYSGSSINFPADISFQADSAYDIGAAGTRVDEAFFDNATTEDLFFRRQGAGSHDFVLTNDATNILRLRDSAATTRMQIDMTGTPTMSLSMALIPSAGGVYDLGGGTTFEWDQVYANTYNVNTAILPSTSIAVDLGSNSLKFNDAYFDNWTINSISILPLIASTAAIGNSTFPLSSVNTDNLVVNSSALPDVNEGASLGLDGVRWDNFYVDDIRVDNDIIPRSNDTSILGGPSNEFAHIYTDDLTITGTCTGCGGGGTPGGSDTHVQYNDGGAFGGESTFTYNDASNILTVQDAVFSDDADVTDDLQIGDEIRIYGGTISGNYQIKLEGSSGSTGDDLEIRNSSGTWRVRIGVLDSGGDGSLSLNGDVDVDLTTVSSGPGLYVGGNKVVSSRGSAITNPTGGSTIDSEARTAIDAILSRMESHGLISP